MERLTKIDDYSGRNIIETNRFTRDDDWIISEKTDGITISFSSKAIDKLAEFEDFMEEQGFEDLEDLKRYMEQSFKVAEILTKVRKEKQALKSRWQELKEWVNTRYSDYRFEGHIVSPQTQELDAITNKMQELEQIEN